MLTNKEKFLALVSKEPNDTMEKIKWRIENRELLREQQRAQLDFMVALDKLDMAILIKDIPVLTGKDAERFLARIAENKKASPEEIAKCKESYEAMLRIMEKSKK